MSDHADHHHAAPAKPDATTTMGFALMFGMVTVIISLIGAIRDSSVLLTIGLLTGIAAIVVGILAVLIAKRTGGTSRGFLVSVVLGISGIAMYLLVTNV
jgi:Co/Zn/Cd efflux system component